MPNDKLASFRAERQGDGVNHHEMTIRTPDALPGSNFFSKVDSIQSDIEKVNANVSKISNLQERMLAHVDDGHGHDAAQLDQLVTDTRVMISGLRERIRDLGDVSTAEEMRRNRVNVLRKNLLEAIQNYHRVEQDHIGRSKKRIARQIRIVKPDATREEINTAYADGGQQVFAQALTSSASATSVLREVRERQRDLKKMEDTLIELAKMTEDLATMVEEQDKRIGDIEGTAQEVERETEIATKHLRKAILHAISARKARWICFGIFVIILAIVAIVVGVIFGPPKK